MGKPAIHMPLGTRYGRLVVAGPLLRDGRRTLCEFMCDCGSRKKIRVDGVRNGHTSSCGCQIVERAKRGIRLTHGAAKSPEYKIWSGMITRCENLNVKHYDRYGGRGIAVCERWRNEFASFLADMGPRPSPKHSINRIDNDGNYEPGNCEWADQKVQARNKRSTRRVEYQGQMMSLADAAERSGIAYYTLQNRLYRGTPLFPKETEING